MGFNFFYIFFGAVKEEIVLTLVKVVSRTPRDYSKGVLQQGREIRPNHDRRGMRICSQERVGVSGWKIINIKGRWILAQLI